MKKFKIVLVSVVALILCLLCVTGNTFSWFSRPKELSGKQLDLTSKKYYSSVLDNIEIKSYSSSDGVNYGTTEVKGFSEISGVASGNRRYFRTDIYNKGANAQSVSLYLDSITFASNCDGFALGVNGPSKTYKNFTFSEEAVVSEIYLQNVYLGLNKIEVDEGKLTGKVDYIHSWGNGLESDAFWSPSGPEKNPIVNTGKVAQFEDSSGWKETRDYYMYAGLIDSRCNQMMLKTKDFWFEHLKPTIYNSNGYVNNTMIFYEYGNKYYAEAEISDFNSRLDTFYSKAHVQVGESANLAATYHGKSIEYTSSNDAIATVSDAGVVTGVSAGSAIITVKVYGTYGDCISSQCVVSVSSGANSLTDVPIVTNVNVQPSVADTDGVVAPSVSVYWYIKNDSEKSAMTYNISNLYLTL